jgi:ATP-dependent Clp protease ATP-binding subunit ClpC
MKELAVLVERAVRPVRAGPARKLRMREELFTHLTGIFEEEKARLGGDAAALAEAARRFGDPAALTADLQASLTLGDRAAAALDRWFGWRPPESAARYSLRLAGQVFLFLLPWFVFAATLSGMNHHPAAGRPDAAVLVRGWAAMLVIGTAEMFVFGWLYYRMRDALHGPPWAAKSRGRVAVSAALLALSVPVCAVALELATTLDPRMTFGIVDWPGVGAVCLMGVAAAGFTLWLALRDGPGEIRHTIWCCLDLRGEIRSG